MPFNARFAAVTTALGVQAGHQRLTAPSPDDPGSAVQRPVGTRTTTRASPATCSTSSSSPTPPRRRSPAASSMSICTARRRISRRTSCPTAIRSLGTGAQPVLHAEERQRRPDPEPARRSRRQRHRAICRARAEARRTVLARRARRDRDLRHRQSEPDDRDRANRSKLGLRRATGPLRFEATAYYTRFNNFIYRRLTGVICGEDFDSCGMATGTS